jgi:hypothetical protein
MPGEIPGIFFCAGALRNYLSELRVYQNGAGSTVAFIPARFGRAASL